jgi:hypothetical protein
VSELLLGLKSRNRIILVGRGNNISKNLGEMVGGMRNVLAIGKKVGKFKYLINI